MNNIQNLKPSLIWKYFDEILAVPRPSKKEEKIIAYLEKFANTNNLDYKKDDIGNILITKPATSGMENTKSVVFQSHIDMVCEKNSDVDHDFDKDPIHAYIDGEWLKAKGTTLGADNGIGVATQLALLAETTIKHGPIECIFTVDEETGLTGANHLGKDFFDSKILINLDSEDEGEIYIGCAGGVDTLISYPLEFQKTDKEQSALQISVKGLKGGHSGDDINKGFGNSNKILTRIIWEANKQIGVQVHDFQGGNLRNAIPREANAIISVLPGDLSKLKELIKTLEGIIQQEFIHTEPNLVIDFEAISTPAEELTAACKIKLFNAIYACPNGVMAMSHTVPGLVETSTNLASVHFLENGQAEIVTSQRSSIETAKWDIANSIKSTFELIDAKIWNTDSYPGWTPNTDSEILKIAKGSYEKLFSKIPEVKAIHAGLECGLFLEKYPELDMISVGPTMRGVHSPDERLHIESVSLYWDFVVEILENIPQN